ncbi:hypothetical protein PsYK624_040320 [Phanerochaete sordida]|uniref:F-box domain-containing protein n=1 Tax=Phanerochaete sordida TaxID=48140 RepID=A0A9P3G5M8_9APHY|nr:hypothetical protein PsYK624_040320 [Phanerochaete sordida]
MSIARVCTRWRSVALDDHDMWTDVDLDTFGHDALALYRVINRTAPFNVVSSGWHESLPLFSDDTRAFVLFITADMSVSTPPSDALSFSKLEDLTITMLFDGRAPCHVVDYAVILERLLPQVSPRRLVLSGCRFVWGDKKYADLTELSITCGNFTDAGSSSNDVLSVCRMSPGLRSLKLALRHNYGAQPSTQNAARLPLIEPIAMQFLRSLTLEMPYSDIMYILQSVSLPQEGLEQLKIAISTEEDSVGDLQVFLKDLPIPCTFLHISSSLTLLAKVGITGISGSGRYASNNACSWELHVVRLGPRLPFIGLVGMLPRMPQLEELCLAIAPVSASLVPDSDHVAREEALEMSQPLARPGAAIKRLVLVGFDAKRINVVQQRLLALKSAAADCVLQELVLTETYTMFPWRWNQETLGLILPLGRALADIPSFRKLTLALGDVHSFSRCISREDVVQALRDCGIAHVEHDSRAPWLPKVISLVRDDAHWV